MLVVSSLLGQKAEGEDAVGSGTTRVKPACCGQRLETRKRRMRRMIMEVRIFDGMESSVIGR